ncbi:Asp23/Gls24 family envelope stress response protein [Asanoa sp. WMMD1127]|uniref:Asp23/Gls24 family envelope stress response protein n=1 Tax=Asanoa sp. WMMD1127 TaxID=3016107 RepID=UPI002415B959|nr:Asp23/Gls24 family envelope stress response protein [Asanoa sp. WMMD1127]MDG4825905.1 Asp23/Gls24 family envelope stress response protein [Asanoa sp. WMMD1127]
MTQDRPVGTAHPTTTPRAERHLAEAAPAPPPAPPDPDWLGEVNISPQVVAKLAAQAVYEHPVAGAAAPRMFGSTLPGAGHLGIRGTDLTSRPKVSAWIDGSVAYVDMSISVRWAESLGEVTERIRNTVEDRIKAWTGLTVARVRISVTDLVVDGAS